MFFRKKKLDVSTYHGSGLVKSPFDDRDFLFSSMVTTPIRIPEEFPPPFDLTIHNQGASPSCVGWACATLKEEKELKERNALVFDGEWIYKECKKIDGIPNVRGTFFRAGMKILKDLGAMSFIGGDPARFKIGSYAKVDDTSFEGLKKAFVINGNIVIGYQLSRDGWSGKYVRPPKAGETTTGHAVDIIGYTKDYLIGQNSWGTGWGDKGWFYIPKGYAPMEAWSVLSDLPTGEIDQGVIGWLAEKFIEDYKVVPSIGLNLRQGAGTSHSIIQLLKQGTFVEPLGERAWNNGHWWIRVRVESLS